MQVVEKGGKGRGGGKRAGEVKVRIILYHKKIPLNLFSSTRSQDSIMYCIGMCLMENDDTLDSRVTFQKLLFSKIDFCSKVQGK